MLLRPVHIKSENNSDIKGLPTSDPEIPETSYSNETQESSINNSIMQNTGQLDKSLTVSQNQSEEFNNRPNRNRLLMSNEEYYKKKAISQSCKQKIFDVSLFQNPFFYIFTWSFLLSQLAYFIPTFHLVARAKTLGINVMDASYLVSVAGKKNYQPSTYKEK
jgi:MCP family monocarboxylic acid transporter-like MFS transporter 4